MQISVNYKTENEASFTGATESGLINARYPMNIFELKGSDDTPAVYLDQKNGIFEISGRSLPEDTVTFYAPILDWITTYAQAPNPLTNFTFKLDYFNTASSKLILDLITALSKIEGMTIVWCYQDDDEEIREAGEEFSEQINVPFEFRAY